MTGTGIIGGFDVGPCLDRVRPSVPVLEQMRESGLLNVMDNGKGTPVSSMVHG